MVGSWLQYHYDSFSCRYFSTIRHYSFTSDWSSFDEFEYGHRRYQCENIKNLIEVWYIFSFLCMNTPYLTS